MKNKNCIYLSYMVKVKVLVTQSCSIFCDPMGCSPPSSSVHGIFQAILEWAAIPFSWGSSQPRDWTWVSCIAGRFFIVWATREAPFEIFIMYTFKNVCVYSFSKVIEVKSKKTLTHQAVEDLRYSPFNTCPQGRRHHRKLTCKSARASAPAIGHRGCWRIKIDIPGSVFSLIFLSKSNCGQIPILLSLRIICLLSSSVNSLSPLLTLIPCCELNLFSLVEYFLGGTYPRHHLCLCET